MKYGDKILVSLLAGLLLPTAGALARATYTAPSSSGSPYGAIVERNIFDLKTPPPPPKNEPPPPPPPNVKLVGLTTLPGYPEAIFSVTKPATPGKAPEPPESYILKEGQRSDSLEVLAIDMKGRSARIRNEGMVLVLAVEESKGMPGGGGGALGQPGFLGGGTPKAAFGGYTGPQAGGGEQVAAGNGQAAQNSQQYAPGPNGQYAPAPDITTQGRPIRTDQPYSYEQQVVLIEAQRAQALSLNDPVAKILPPTPLTPLMQDQQQQQQDQNGTTAPAVGGPTVPGALGPRTTGNFSQH